MTTDFTAPTMLEQCRALDAQDPLRAMRQQFDLPAGVIYLDGNSLGPLPRRTAERVAQAIHGEWGTGLIRSWNSAGWFEAPQRVGDKIGQLIGANAGEVVATDTTSINLYKVLSAAISIAKNDHPTRSTVVSERSNFPTDLYIAESLCRQHGLTLQLIEPEELAGLLASPAAPNIAVLMLTHVNYRTGAMHDMASVTAAAHAAGALMVWDLAHSAGAVPVDLNGANADFAVGCGYKYLNGGPGAPAFAWVNPRLADRFWQPLSGWWGHAAPFQFTPDYQPAPGIARYLCGTQPILSLTALECGLDTFLGVRDCVAGEPMAALRRKSLALTDLFIARVEARCAGHGLRLVTPREHQQRGSQVCLARDEGAYAMVQALIARGVIGDYRAPDVLRFGFTPLYLSFEDVWNAAEHLAQVLESGEWRQPEFNRQHAVT
ncbi:kynureninase [Curvibacter sp. CHRR-16]|uniref:kynureninase n=1 Tax=Curvibacter sp. CHRR-16 TaxID=2835872 RepID=UPI001BD914D5|nr:kynureninase [Curvibacter sp. CHRR-16]MBT0569377.1 kynureninase [Curvibacter sp. CHRR-16]